MDWILNGMLRHNWVVQFIKTQVSNEIKAKVWKRCQLDCSDKKIPIHTNSLSIPFHRPCHSLFFGRDHLRSNIGITCGQGSFAVQFGDHLRSGIICGPGIICGLVQALLTGLQLWYNCNFTRKLKTWINCWRHQMSSAKYVGSQWWGTSCWPKLAWQWVPKLLTCLCTLSDESKTFSRRRFVYRCQSHWYRHWKYLSKELMFNVNALYQFCS